MTTHSVQSMAVQPGVATAPSAASTASADQSSHDSFVETLNKVLGDSGIETSNDLAALLTAGIIPAGVLLAIVPQTNNAEVEQLVQQLLSAIQSADPLQLKEILEHPALHGLLDQTRLASWDRTASVHVSSASSNREIMDMQTLFMEALDDSGIEAEQKEILHNLMSRLGQLLQLNKNDVFEQQMSAELKSVMKQLAASFPALFVKNEFDDEGMVKKGHTVDGNAIKSSNNDTTDSSGPNQGQTNSQLHLQRLSFMRPLVHIISKTNGPWTDSSLKTENPGDQNQSSSSTQPLLQKLSFMKPLVHPVTITNGSLSDSTAVTSETTVAMMTAGDSAVSEGDPTLSIVTESLRASSAAGVKPAPLATIRADQFATEMGRFMVKNMSISQLGGMSEAKITLMPEHLGQLDVKITVQNGQITAHFVAESAGARDLLENQLPQLRSALQQQGLQVEKLVVSHHQSYGSGMFQDGREQQPSRQQSGGGNRSNRQGDAGGEFTLEIGNAIETDIMTDYGSSFHATA